LDPALASELSRGCAALGLDLGERAQAGLLDYLGLLHKWNHTYNLTAVRDPAQMVTRHLLDSLAVAPHLDGSRVLDVGTGAGLPGVPLALACPGRELHLLDSNGKKARFLFQVKTALRLDNMVVHRARVEAFAPEAPFDAILSRAFASLGEMFEHCRPLLAPGGRMLAMKGARPDDELRALDGKGVDLTVNALSVPGLAEQRHLVNIRIRED